MRSLLFVLLCGVCSGFEPKTIFQYLSDNPQSYSTLTGLLTTTGLDAALSGTGPFTIFAPTNAAFAKLDPATLNGLAQAPSVLTEVLKYHVVGEFVLIPVISAAQSKASLEGQSINIARSASGLTLNGVANTVSPADIVVENGVVQPIDTVLLPPIMPTAPAPTTTTAGSTLTIAQILLMDDAQFKDLFLALLLADLVNVLDSGDFTVFAPVDAAFVPFKDNLLDPSQPGAQALYQQVLKNHVVPGARMASDLRDGQTLYTLQGTGLNVKISSAGVTVNGAQVIQADIKASNGVIHAVNQVIVPADIGATTTP